MHGVHACMLVFAFISKSRTEDQTCYRIIFDNTSTLLYSHSRAGEHRLLKKGHDINVTCVTEQPKPGCLHEPVILYAKNSQNCSNSDVTGPKSVTRTFCNVEMEKYPPGELLSVEFQCRAINSSCRTFHPCTSSYNRNINRIIAEPLDFNLSCIYYPQYTVTSRSVESGNVQCRIYPELSIQETHTQMTSPKYDYSAKYQVFFASFPRQRNLVPKNGSEIDGEAFNVSIPGNGTYMAVWVRYPSPVPSYTKESPFYNFSLHTIAAPPTINDFNLTSVSQSEVCFDWTIESDVIDYIVRVQYQNKTAEMVDINSKNGCIQGLDPNTTYTLEMSIKRTESIYWTSAGQTKKLTVVTSSLPRIQTSRNNVIILLMVVLATILAISGVIIVCRLYRRKFKKKLEFTYIPPNSEDLPAFHANKYSSQSAFRTKATVIADESVSTKEKLHQNLSAEQTSTSVILETDEDLAGCANVVFGNLATSSESYPLDKDTGDHPQDQLLYATMQARDHPQDKSLHSLLPVDGRTDAVLTDVNPELKSVDRNHEYFPVVGFIDGEGIPSLVECKDNQTDEDLSDGLSVSSEVSDLKLPSHIHDEMLLSQQSGPMLRTPSRHSLKSRSGLSSHSSGYDSMHRPEDNAESFTAFVHNLLNPPISPYSKAAMIPTFPIENNRTLDTECKLSSHTTGDANDDFAEDGSGSFDCLEGLVRASEERGCALIEEKRESSPEDNKTLTALQYTTTPLNTNKVPYQTLPENSSQRELYSETDNELGSDSGGYNISSGQPTEHFVNNLLSNVFQDQ